MTYRFVFIFWAALATPLHAMLLTADTSSPPSSVPHHQPSKSQPTWRQISVNGQIPQQDYTLALIQNRTEVITGGPLFYGPALAGIWDITGPDWSEIAAYLDSEAGLRAQATLVAEYINPLRPPVPQGVDPSLYHLPMTMVNLRPQTLWLLKNGKHQQLEQAAVPEPTTGILLFVGGIWLGCRYQKTT